MERYLKESLFKQLLAEGAAKGVVLRETLDGFNCECTIPWSEQPYLLQSRSGKSRSWKNLTRFITYAKGNFPNLSSITVIFLKGDNHAQQKLPI